jgi:hypothetical protein
MSGRIEKRKQIAQKKSSETVALVKYLELNGTDTDMPCTRCFKRKVACRVAPGNLSRCLNCVKSRKSCDGSTVASSRTLVGDVCVCAYASFG